MYELTYIISPIANGLNNNAVASKIRSFIEGDLEGKIKKEYIGEKKRLSYPIKKQSAGSYVSVEFVCESNKMDELKKFLELNNDILRHLILSVKEKTRIKKPARVKPSTTAIPAEEIFTGKTEKVGIEELDRKLEELLK